MSDIPIHVDLLADDRCSSRFENQIKETQDKLEKKKTEIIQIQSGAQAAGGKGKDGQ